MSDDEMTPDESVEKRLRERVDVLEKKLHRLRHLEGLVKNPFNFQYHWMLSKGASLRIEITGRWTPEDVATIRLLFGKIAEVFDLSADDQEADND